MTVGPTSANRVEAAPLFVEAWNGVVKRLESLYSSKSGVAGPRGATILPVPNPSALRQMILAQERKFDLPVVGVTPVNVDPNESSLNASVARKHGVTFALDEGSSFWYVLKARPVIQTYQVTIVTDDVLTMMRMVDRWESNEIWGFTLAVPDSPVKVRIKVVPDKSLSIPPSAASVDGSNQFELTTNLKVETMAGFIWKIPAIRAVELTANVAKHSIAEALNDPNMGVEVVNASITKIDLDSAPEIKVR